MKVTLIVELNDHSIVHASEECMDNSEKELMLVSRNLVSECATRGMEMGLLE